MNPYAKYVLPRLTDLVMRNKADEAERAKLIPRAFGVVLEVGIGSALNVPYYGAAVRALYGVDPSLELWKIGRRRVQTASFPIEFLPGSAERIPLADAVVDTVVSTWTLCTIPNPAAALAEIKRILKPEAELLFIEHGWAPDRHVQVWQSRLTPVWKRIAGGCHMDRKIDHLVADAGLRIVEIERGYGSGLKPLAYLYKGRARRCA